MLIGLEGRHKLSDCSRIHWAEGQEEFSFGFTSDLSLLRQLTPHRRPGQTKTAAQHCSCLETWALQVWRNPMNAAFHCLAFCRFLIFYSHFSFCLASFAPLVLCCSLILLQLAPSVTDFPPLYLMSFLTLPDRRFINLILNHVTAEWSQRWAEQSGDSCQIFDLMEAFIPTPYSPMSACIPATVAPVGH